MRELLTFTARFYGTPETQEFESLSRGDAFLMAQRYAAEHDLIVEAVSQEVGKGGLELDCE
jgi:hypothetical protein